MPNERGRPDLARLYNRNWNLGLREKVNASKARQRYRRARYSDSDGEHSSGSDGRYNRRNRLPLHSRRVVKKRGPERAFCTRKNRYASSATDESNASEVEDPGPRKTWQMPPPLGSFEPPPRHAALDGMNEVRNFSNRTSSSDSSHRLIHQTKETEATDSIQPGTYSIPPPPPLSSPTDGWDNEHYKTIARPHMRRPLRHALSAQDSFGDRKEITNESQDIQHAEHRDPASRPFERNYSSSSYETELTAKAEAADDVPIGPVSIHPLSPLSSSSDELRHSYDENDENQEVRRVVCRRASKRERSSNNLDGVHPIYTGNLYTRERERGPTISGSDKSESESSEDEGRQWEHWKRNLMRPDAFANMRGRLLDSATRSDQKRERKAFYDINGDYESDDRLVPEDATFPYDSHDDEIDQTDGDDQTLDNEHVLTASRSGDGIYGENLHELNDRHPGKHYIRLLRPLHSDARELVCELRVCSMKEAPAYSALSYSWGGNGPAANLCLVQWIRDGTKCIRDSRVRHLSVTEDLARAFRRIGVHNTHGWLWIDAICINQTSNDEKSDQVRRMRMIYQNAKCVFVWLGESMPDSKQDIYAAHRPFREDKNTWRQKWHSDIDPSPFRLAQVGLSYRKRRDLVRQGAKAWYRRVWVLQEVAVCKIAKVCIGSIVTDWDIFKDIFMSEANSYNVIGPSLRNIGGDVGYYDACMMWASAQESFIELAKLRDEFKFRDKPAAELYGFIVPQPERKKHGRSVVGLLKQTQTFASSDPADIVYSLLGLATETDRGFIPIQYGVDLMEVFVPVMKILADDSGDLDFIFEGLWPRGNGIGVTASKSSDTEPDKTKRTRVEECPKPSLCLPTWMLDFSAERNENALEIQSLPLVHILDCYALNSDSPELEWQLPKLRVKAVTIGSIYNIYTELGHILDATDGDMDRLTNDMFQNLDLFLPSQSQGFSLHQPLRALVKEDAHILALQASLSWLSLAETERKRQVKKVKRLISKPRKPAVPEEKAIFPLESPSPKRSPSFSGSGLPKYKPLQHVGEPMGVQYAHLSLNSEHTEQIDSREDVIIPGSSTYDAAAIDSVSVHKKAAASFPTYLRRKTTDVQSPEEREDIELPSQIYQKMKWSYVKLVREHGVLFSTDIGMIGFTFAKVQKGDQLVVPMGASTPWILRRCDLATSGRAGEGLYTLIDEAYVDGIMSGELYDLLGQDSIEPVWYDVV